MVPPQRYSIDPRQLVHETIDGETIVIALETGVYFSLTGSAAEIWRLLLEGWSPGEIAAAFGGSTGDAIDTLVAELLAAGLIALDPDVATPAGAPAVAAWEPPVFQTYTDMEYFLLLDPVHDVEAAGWPHAKPAETSDVGNVD